jgi:hypothetical protein
MCGFDDCLACRPRWGGRERDPDAEEEEELKPMRITVELDTDAALEVATALRNEAARLMALNVERQPSPPGALVPSVGAPPPGIMRRRAAIKTLRYVAAQIDNQAK